MKKLLITATTILSTAAFAGGGFTDKQTQEIKSLVGSYIKENPQAVMQAFESAMALQQQEELKKMKEAVVSNKDKLYNYSESPVAGNVNSKTQLVVFMDPYCGFCKKFHTELNKVLSENKDFKVIYKDIAIMGHGSNLAVRALLAAQKQGKYIELQDKIFSSDKHLTKKQIMKEAKDIGIDVAQLDKDMESDDVRKIINDSMNLATALGVNGTPTLILGDNVHPGYLTAEDLNAFLKSGGTTTSAADPKDAKENKA